MNKISLIFIMTISLLLLNACKSENTITYKQANQELQNTIQNLEQQIEELETELTEYKRGTDINYISYSDTKRFIPQEVDIMSLPREKSVNLRTVFPNTVVEVLDAASVDNKELWLYVAVPTLDSPSNNRGWIKESDTLPYTRDMQELVEQPIVVKAGAAVYEGYDYDEAFVTASVIINNELYGRIDEKKDEFARVISPGGYYCWVKQEDIILLPVE